MNKTEITWGVMCIYSLIFFEKTVVLAKPSFYGSFQWHQSKRMPYDIDRYEEIVHLPTEPSNNYTIKFFGRTIHLELEMNNILLPSSFYTQVRIGDKYSILPEDPDFCHYQHKVSNNEEITAALSFCHPNQVTGFIVFGNYAFEVQPLYTNKHESSHDQAQEIFGIYDASLLNTDDYDNINSNSVVVPHVIKRATLPPISSLETDDIYFDENMQQFENKEKRFDFPYTETLQLLEKRASAKKHLTLELALFFDAAGYKLFMPYMKNDYNRIQNMLIAYINGIQALYHHPSLGQRVDIALIRLEIFKTQPSDLPTFEGERTQLLNSFCDFNEKHNPPGDNNPGHWDIGLYVSGLNFYAVENGRKSDITMGLSAVGGVCMEKYSCVIAEFGTTNTFGKPYPSAGFTSVYVAAHEIGHNLGMHHDGTMNNCPKDGYLMSGSRSVTGGETHWSKCSAEVMEKLWSQSCLTDSPGGKLVERGKQGGETPGMMWDAKRQCEILLRDKDAKPITKNSADSNTDICQNLECETPHRTGRYFDGPALDGTTCGSGKWCIAGECVKKLGKLALNKVEGGWSKWRESNCQSGCIAKSKGYKLKSRSCDNPEPLNTDNGCEGPTFEVTLCDSEKICKNKKRISSVNYASERCKEFSTLIKEIDNNAAGFQAPHEISRLWVACTIYCRVKTRDGRSGYYTPRVEFNDLNVDPYFPDGTWCNSDKSVNYYCQKHKCLPEGAKVTSRSTIEDLQHFVQNALPFKTTDNDTRKSVEFNAFAKNQNSLRQYFSLDESGLPILTGLSDELSYTPSDSAWADHDYVDVNN